MLNALLQDELKDVNQKEGFKVTDLEGANWCFRKIRVLQQKIVENKALADVERERISTWEKKENEDAKNTISYFEDLLKIYFSEEKAKDKKFKISTPYGKVTSRKSTKWQYVNEEEVLNYLKENNLQLIRVKEEINKAELKKTFKDGVNQITGEVIPGLEIKQEESISIKVE